MVYQGQQAHSKWEWGKMNIGTGWHEKAEFTCEKATHWCVQEFIHILYYVSIKIMAKRVKFSFGPRSFSLLGFGPLGFGHRSESKISVE